MTLKTQHSTHTVETGQDRQCRRFVSADRARHLAAKAASVTAHLQTRLGCGREEAAGGTGKRFIQVDAVNDLELSSEGAGVRGN